ncbi:MAG TPA: hypothetical protein VLD39_02445, partial [Gammaproteobacteria bacterium]|nr:hypothetical protein [Gammaproteobacteria bacterium]
MRTTDDRYRGERARFELAMRMIRHEARTGTIRYLTGLSDDRIRKLYTSYFKFDAAMPIKRRRGKTPTQILPLIRTPARALESGVFVNLLHANRLLSSPEPPGPPLRGNIEIGNRFCQCYETHHRIIPEPTLTFEWAWNLMLTVRRGDEIGIERCETCATTYLYDLLTLPRAACPACPTLRAERRTARDEVGL